jgi:predicted  nucleic acid-binding Zn-ribbon protein
MNKVSDASRLLTCEQFRVVRDEMQLDSMRKRGADLWERADAKLMEARALRKRADRSDTTKQKRELLMHEYDGLMREWGEMEAELGAILRDHRYVEWKATEYRKASGQ